MARWRTYKNLSGNSSVSEYKRFGTFILIRFKSNGKVTEYRYDRGSAGETEVRILKNLALIGKGLNSRIKKNRVPYDSRK